MRHISFTIIGLLLLALQSQAQNKCVQLFKNTSAVSPEQIHSQKLLEELEIALISAQESRTPAQINDGIHHMVVAANDILDTAMDFMLSIRFSNLPLPQAMVRDRLTGRLIETLQLTFGIPDGPMKRALHHRFQREAEEGMRRHRAHQGRQAIGFGRDQSSIDFHSETGESQPAGFSLSRPHEPTADEDVPSSFAIGFQAASQKNWDQKIDEWVEYTNESSQETSVGFQMTGNSDSNSPPNPIERVPAGFVHFSQTTQGIMRVLFRVETGQFELSQ